MFGINEVRFFCFCFRCYKNDMACRDPLKKKFKLASLSVRKFTMESAIMFNAKGYIMNCSDYLCDNCCKMRALLPDIKANQTEAPSSQSSSSSISSPQDFGTGERPGTQR